MSPPEVWGPAIWTLFHVLAEKVNENVYPFIKVELFSQIKRICGFLPCPECSADATNFLAKININDLKSKLEFRNIFYLFHNWVNAKKRKPLFNYSTLASYNNYRIVHVINNFISKYNTKGNMKLISESFQRNLVLNNFKSWITKNIRAFISPQTIPQNIPDTIIDESVSVAEQVSEESIIEQESDTKEVTSEELFVTEDQVTSEESVIKEVVIEDQIVTEELVTEEVASEETMENL
jgi:hypothetical protein